MSILSLGVSYRAAPVDLLERLAFPQEDLAKAYHRLTRMGSIRGAVIVSTCNRVEVYADVDAYHAGFQELKQFLSESREVAPEEFAGPVYSHYEEQAAEHLFSVAAGVDSMVTGEPQILSQVRAAVRAATEEKAATRELASLFRHAVRAGRRARTETGIAASPGAFVDAGIELAERSMGTLEGASLLVLGAGQMSELAGKSLSERGVGSMRVLNRSLERAQALARKTGGSAGEMINLPDALASADIVVSSTGASGVLVERNAVKRALAARDGRSLFFLDLAVPRDVDPAVASLPGVSVANIDDLGRVVADGDEDEVAKARAIVGEEVTRFRVWRRAEALAPVIHALKEKGERIRAAELGRARAKLARLSGDEREAVEAATKAIVAKLLHHPVVRTKEGRIQAAVLRELFDI